jgi:hypothetical protein
MGATNTRGSTARPQEADAGAVSPNNLGVLEQPGVIDRMLDLATRDALREGEEPVVRRTRLLERMRNGHACFVGTPTQAQLEQIVGLYGGRNPTERMGGLANRFLLQNSAWDGSGAAVTDQIGRGRPIELLTYSFPNDGVVWGPGGQLNRLSADLTGRLMEVMCEDETLAPIPGPGVAYGREVFRQAMANWQRACAVRYMEVCDDDTPWNPDPPPGPGTHGDIRFGSYAQGEGAGILAINYYPEAGGDMALNSSYFVEPCDVGAPPYFSASNGYRFLRNTIAHEHGHGLGFRHVVPCNQTKLMEPFQSTVYDTIQIDEKRGAQHNYGDRFAGRRNPVTGALEGNQTQATAQDLGERWVISPGNPPSDPRYPSTGVNFKQSIPLDRLDAAMGFVPHSAVERDLSTNGPVCISPLCDGTLVENPSGQDWFTFELENAQRVVITADPTGGLYLNGEQTGSDTAPCAGPTFQVPAEVTGNLNVELYDAMGAAPILVANSAGAGVTEVLNAGTIEAGRYWVRVYDSGGSGTMPAPGQPTQLYDLEVRLGQNTPTTSELKFPPLAVAGVDKYVPVGQFVQFIGDLYSRVQEPNTAPLNARIANYEWDLDGDGEFETNVDDFDNPGPGQLPNNPRFPFTTYTGLNDIIPVTLRVTDANGLQATDTIFVTVTGTPISVTSVTPSAIYRGTTVPITITGSGLGAVTNLAQITVSNGFIVLGGTVMVDPAGTTITGVTVTVPAAAPLGPVDLRVSDGCTAGFLNGALVVFDPLPPPPEDQCDMAAAWSAGPGCKPFDNRGATAEVPQDWTGSGCEGETLFSDVWFTWTASQTGALEIDSRSDVPPVFPAPFPSRVAVYRLGSDPVICPPPAVSLAGCGEMFMINVQQGERLLFRVGSTIDGGTGAACVNLGFADVVGACCNLNSGACSVNVTPLNCSGLFVPSNVCSPNPCPQPTGRCCVASGQCAIVTEAICDSVGGVWNINGSTCSPNPCPQPTGACCRGDGGCNVTTQANCSGVWGRDGTCSPNPCPQPRGACCLPDGQCVNSTAAECGAGTFNPGAVCSATSCATVLGSCCIADQACEITSEAACGGGGWTQGGACTPDPCPRMLGACCVQSQACSLTTRLECTGGWAAGTLCNPDPCPQAIMGVCCNTQTGECSVTTQAACTGTFNSSITTCTPAVCPAVRGACCNSATGFCTPLLTQAECTTGAWTPNAACAPGLCPQPTGACCVIAANVCVTGQTAGQCLGLGGTFSSGQACSPSNCPTTGACCDLSGQCTMVFQANCGTSDFRPNGSCVPNPCGPPMGACCNGTSCRLVTATECAAPGVFQGAGSVCGTSGNPTTCCPANINGNDGVNVQDIFDFLALYFMGDSAADFNGSGDINVQDIFDFLAAYFRGCAEVMGACCTGTSCVVVTSVDACGAGTFQGGGTACGPSGNPTTCCPANLNGLDGVTVQDLFIYLAAYPVGDLQADFNGDGTVSLADLFGYLNAFFVGCPG